MKVTTMLCQTSEVHVLISAADLAKLLLKEKFDITAKFSLKLVGQDDNKQIMVTQYLRSEGLQEETEFETEEVEDA
jgi:hypothetical protein